MKKRFAVGLLIGLTLGGNASALFVAPVVIVEPPDEPAAVPTAPTTPSRTPPAAKPDSKPASASSGNPLWVIPLRQLTATVTRPLFAPSRRPPPPVVANVNRAAAPSPSPPPKPAEPEKPPLSLVGTVAAGKAGIGIFFEQGNRNALRLKTGENHKGWTLRMVKRREVVLQKGKDVAVLSLPAMDVKKEIPAAPATTPAATMPANPVPPPPIPQSSNTGPFPAVAPPVQPVATGSPFTNPFDALLQMKQQLSDRPTRPELSR